MDPARKKLFNDADYVGFFEMMKDDFFESEFFRNFCSVRVFMDLAPDFIGDVCVGMYRRWQVKYAGERPAISLESLAGMAEKIILGGLNEVNEG